MATRKQKKNVRVLIRNVRISFPRLDEPRANALNPSAPEKFSATFLLEPGSEAHKTTAAAIAVVADSAWDEKYAAQMRNPACEKQPLHRGDDRPKVYDGYAGMLYFAANSRRRPELRDSNPQNAITDPEEIRRKFLPGYLVNAFVEFWPETRFSNRVCCELIGVQFAGIADVLGGGAVQSCDFPDVSDEAAKTGASDAFTQATRQPFENVGEDIPF